MTSMHVPEQDDDAMITDHPDTPEQGEDEDYVDYICRLADHWIANPPPAPEGFVLIPCDHEPRHWPTYAIATSDFYPPVCTENVVPDLHRRIDQLEHAAHLLRGKVWSRIISWAYVLGIIAGHGSQWNEFCRWCITPIWWRGKRPYILGLSRQQWTCLLRGHRYRPLVDCVLCAICLPCPDCGSTEADHWFGVCEAAK